MSIKHRQYDRIRYLLQDALIALIREQPYQNIEIQAITERANTARVTFYRHYASKDELLLDYLERLYQDLNKTISVVSYGQLLDQENPPSLSLFELIALDKDLYCRLLNSPMGMVIQQRVRLYIVAHVKRAVIGSLPIPEHTITLIANHMASCTLGYISWWLLSADASHYTAREIALLNQTLAIGGIATLIHTAPVKLP